MEARLSIGKPTFHVLGQMDAAAIAQRLQDAGATNDAARVSQLLETAKGTSFAPLAEATAFRWPWQPKETPLYLFTDHAFGFIRKRTTGQPTTDVVHAGEMDADFSLKGANLLITLDRLRVAEYPGGGRHNILFDFYAQHQTIGGATQDLHFSQSYIVQEGSGAGVNGKPIFVGLTASDTGVNFKCATINVNNDEDQKVLGFLSTDVFSNGLKLVNAINPVIPIVTGFAKGILEAFAHRNDNIPVQFFELGLDFSGVTTHAQLREGSYVAVQVENAAHWDWTAWKFRPASGEIVSSPDESQTIPYNYIVFSVSRIG